jgi:hypothetical protein
MSGKIVVLALVLILAVSGVSVGLQAATVRIEIAPVQRATQLERRTPSLAQTEEMEATEFVATPDLTDCLPVEATPEATMATTDEAISATFIPTPLATPDCPPFEATPDLMFTPEATPDVFIATPEATEDEDSGRGRGRGRGGDNDSGDDDNSGRGGGSDNSGRGGGDD